MRHQPFAAPQPRHDAVSVHRFLPALRSAFVATALLWAIALPLAPIAARSRTVGRAEHASAALTYIVGALVCHQQAQRSFHTAGVQWPVCARCTGIYAGGALAAVMFVGRADRRRGATLDLSRARRAILLSAMPIAATLAFEWTTGVTPSNLARAVSGVPFGASVAWLIVRTTEMASLAGEIH